MNTPEYERVLSLMVYSFAVRLPVLKNVKTSGGYLNDKQIKTIYDMVISKGAGNYDNVIADDFEEIRRMVKSGKPGPRLRRGVVQGVYLHLRAHACRPSRTRMCSCWEAPIYSSRCSIPALRRSLSAC